MTKKLKLLALKATIEVQSGKTWKIIAALHKE
jgi:hypothetical protein